MKKITSLVTATALALAVSTAPSSAHNKAAGIAAGIIAAGLIGAAIAKHQHKRGYPEYKPHPDVDANENAVGKCVHRGLSEVKKAGGYDFQLEHVNSVVGGSNGSTDVSFVANGYYTFGHRTLDVICVISDGHIIRFDYS